MFHSGLSSQDSLAHFYKMIGTEKTMTPAFVRSHKLNEILMCFGLKFGVTIII